MSLSGKTIVVTRDASQAKPFVNLLKEKNADVLLFPTIKLTDTDDSEVIQKVATRISDFDWIVFTSAIAIRFFMKYVNGDDLKNLKIACVGKKTAAELSIHNLTADLIPSKFTLENLLHEMKKLDLKDKKICIPCSSLSNNDLKAGFENGGAIVEQIVVYKNEPFIDQDKTELIEKIVNKKIDCITFFSPSAVYSFILLTGTKYLEMIRKQNILFAVIGSTTEKAVINCDFLPIIKPVESDNQSMVEALTNYFSI
jgi:uroporphyrinogen-III synthase